LRKINTCAVTGVPEITDLVGCYYYGSCARASEKLLAEKEAQRQERRKSIEARGGIASR